VVLPDPGISPHHVTIIPRAGGYNLVDLTAVMDVKVNGKPVKSRILALDDRISIGDIALDVTLWEDASVPDASRDKIVVSTETSSADEAGLDDGIAPGPEPETEKTPVPAPSSPSYYGLDSAIKEQRLRKERRVRWAIAAIVAGAIAAVVAASMAYVSAEKNRLRRRYEAARAYAASHPADLAVAISQYEEIRSDAVGLDARIEKAVSDEIARLKAQMEADTKRFQSLLAAADEKSGALAKNGEYEEALKAYQPDDAALRARFAAARSARIAELRQKAAEKAAAMKEETARLDADQASRTLAEAEATLRELAKLAASACVEGRTAEAIEELEKAMASEAMSAHTNRIAEALKAVRVLGSVDSTFAGSGAAADGKASLPDEDSAHILQSLPAPVRLVFAVRKHDLASAREIAAIAGEGMLVEGLRPFIAAMAEAAARADLARTALAEIWAKGMGSGERLPPPKEAANAFSKKLDSSDREKALRLASELARFAEKNADTDAAREYVELIAAATQAAKGTAARADAFGGLGDGRIIEIDGDKYYVETTRDFTDPEGLRMGLCKPQIVYTGVGTNTAVAAHVEVYSVVPFKPLGGRQFVFSVLAGAKQPAPALGDMVLVGKDIQTGARFVARESAAAGEKIFAADFERRIDQEWRAGSDAVVGLENGRLVFDMPSEPGRINPEGGDLDLALDIGSSGFILTFDLQRRPEKSLVIVIGSLEIVLGEADGRRQGIYADGRLVRAAEIPRPVMGAFQRISIARYRSLARIDVGGSTWSCPIAPETGGQDVRKILFYHTGRMLLDNVSVYRIAGSGDAEIAGVSQDRRDILVARGAGGEWETVGPGADVYVFSAEAGAGGTAKAVARVIQAEGPWLIARMEKPVDIRPHTAVSLSPSRASAERKDEYESPVSVVSKRLSAPQAMLGFRGSGKVVVLDSAGAAPDAGFVHPAREIIVSPTTHEVLAAVPGDGARCGFRQKGIGVVCERADGQDLGVEDGGGVLISKTPLVPGRAVDVGGGFMIYVPGGASGLKDMWKPLNGDWKEKMGRWVGTPGILSEGPPSCQFDDMFGEAFQFDIEFRIEKQTAAPADEWMRDVLFEIYFPASRSGASVGLGSAGRGGMSVQGHAIRAERGARSIAWSGPAPKGFGAKIDTRWPAGSPVLRTGQSYVFRIRRVADVAAFYINGKRLARVADKCFVGGALVRAAAPGAVVSIGRISITELSRSARIPESEPVLGEFGYVAGVVGGQMIVDADGKDIAPGARLSVMEVEKIIEGASSRTAILKRAVTASVSELGRRTARSACPNDGGVKAGMKVLGGTLPAGSQTFPDSRLMDIDLGL